MNAMVNKMLKGKNVIKIFFGLVCISLIGCSTQRLPKDSHYTIEFYKSKRWLTPQLKIIGFDFADKNNRTNLLVNINGVYFESFYKDSYKDIDIWVSPGKYIISAEPFGKAKINIENLSVKEKDSIVIKFYLEDSDKPIE